MRIVIAEDDPLHRTFLRSEIEKTLPLPLHIVEAADGDAAIALVCAEKTDAVVLDLQMPKVSGAEAARVIWQHDPAIRILFWTNYADEAYVRGVSKIVPPDTVYGYVLKSSSEARTRFAIQAVFMEDQCVIDREVRGVQQRTQNRTEGLTDLEYEVLVDIALGLTDRTIGNRRVLSTRGVQSRLRHLYEKLGLDMLEDIENNSGVYNLRAKAVCCAMLRGLINIDTLASEEKKFQDWLAIANFSE